MKRFVSRSLPDMVGVEFKAPDNQSGVRVVYSRADTKSFVSAHSMLTEP